MPLEQIGETAKKLLLSQSFPIKIILTLDLLRDPGWEQLREGASLSSGALVKTLSLSSGPLRMSEPISSFKTAPFLLLGSY